MGEAILEQIRRSKEAVDEQIRSLSRVQDANEADKEEAVEEAQEVEKEGADEEAKEKGADDPMDVEEASKEEEEEEAVEEAKEVEKALSEEPDDDDQYA